MAVLLWVSQASVTYDLHKCEWVSRASPSVFGVILLRSKIFYCAHSCQRLPQWCRDFLLSLPPARCSCSIFNYLTSRLQSETPRIISAFSEPWSSSVCALTGFGEQQSQYSIMDHGDIGDLPILEGEGTCQGSRHFSQGKAFGIKQDCVWGCSPGYRVF